MVYEFINFIKEHNLSEYLRLLKYVNHNSFSARHFRNRLNVLKAYHYRDTMVKGFAPMVHLEPTNACNLSCEICPRDRQSRPEGQMDFALYQALIDELAVLHTELIYLHLFGEPTLHPKIFEMIKYAKRKNMAVGMSTNGTTLDSDITKYFLASGIDILIISFDAADNPEYYERIRKKADYHQVFSNLKNFINTKKNKKPFTIIQTIRMVGSENADKFLEKILPKYSNLIICNQPYDEWGGNVERINKLSTINIRYKNRARLCDKLWRTTAIHYDGSVVPCCRFYDRKYVLGKFPEQSLRQIWNGEGIAALRQLHIKGRLLHEYCKSCHYVGLSLPEEVILTLMDTVFFEKAMRTIQEVRDRKFTL